MPASSVFTAAPQPPQLWAAHIASQADFPDERLNSRLEIILTTRATKPTESIPQAAGSWGQAKAVYRFLSNPRLDVDDILQPLVDTTLDSLRALPTVLAVQDTSSANYASLVQTRGWAH